MWTYTPRQIAGWLWFSRQRINRERAVSISDNAAAARGDPKDLKKQLKELQEPK